MEQNENEEGLHSSLKEVQESNGQDLVHTASKERLRAFELAVVNDPIISNHEQEKGANEHVNEPYQRKD